MRQPLPVPISDPKPNKYHAQPTYYLDIRYDSRAEAERARELDQMVSAHAIFLWMPHPVLRLGPARIRYTPDFMVVARGGEKFWYEDVKGKETERFKVIRQLWFAHGPAPLHVLKRDRQSATGWACETIGE